MQDSATESNWLLPSAVTGAGVGLFETVWATFSASSSTKGFDVIWVALSLMLLGLAVGVLVGLGLAVVRLGAPAVLRTLEKLPTELWSAEQTDRGLDLLVGVVTVPLAFLVMLRSVENAQVTFHDQHLMAIIQVGEVLLLVGLAGLVWGVLRGLLGRATSALRSRLGPRKARFVSSRTATLVVGLGFVAVMWKVWAATAELRRAVDLSWLLSIVVFVALLLVLRRPLGHRRRPALLAAVLLSGVSSLAADAFLFPFSQTSAATVYAGAPLGGIFVRRLIRLSDVDDDGYGSWFGAGDCAPFEPTIGPDALDLPDDGIDQDCSGSDLRRAAVPAWEAGWTPSGVPGRNLVLITVDALRRDRVGAYLEQSEADSLTPNIDRFMGTATRFERAYSTSSRSVWVFASLFTGRLPSEVAWGPERPVPAFLMQNDTLAEVLTRAGYETRAYVSTGYFHHPQHLYQGFQTVDATPIEEIKGDAKAMATSFVRWLKTRQDPRPFFVWVHLFDPHSPYTHRPEFVDEDDLASNYAGEIRYTDQNLKRLLQTLGRAPFSENTVVVFASDHGEAFGEHGDNFHGRTLFGEVLEVPLAISVPGAPARVLQTPVSLVDLFPTMLDLLGLQVEQQLSGRTLTEAIRTGEEPDGRPVFSELIPDGSRPERQWALLRRDLKLIVDVHLGSKLMFDLSADPDELENLYDNDADEAAALMAALREVIERIELRQIDAR